MIELANIAIGYKEILFRVEELSLKKGQLVTLIGPNGSGKTTFLNTILGILNPLEGEVIINGEKLNTLNKKDKVQLFSHVASKFDGVNYLTVEELIAMGRAPYTNILNRLSANDKAVVDKVMTSLGIDHLKNQVTTRISDGERQIAMIGKALAQETALIVLDEPTAFLDYANRMKIMQLLQKIARDQNKLILFSTHNLELSIEYSDLILAVNQKIGELKQYTSAVAKEDIIREVFE